MKEQREAYVMGIKSFVDDDFIQKVICKYSDMIFRVALQYVRNKADAEDIVQDTFLSFVKYAPNEKEELIKAWLIRVAINKSKDVLKSKAYKVLPLDDAIIISIPEAGNYAELQQALDKLDSMDRTIIYLHYYEGYTAKEIGSILRKSEKAIYKRLSRSRQALKSYLEEGDKK